MESETSRTSSRTELILTGFKLHLGLYDSLAGELIVTLFGDFGLEKPKLTP